MHPHTNLEANLKTNQSVGNLTERNQLSRSLTLFPTTALVIGSVVGSGIFVSSAGMVRDLPYPSVPLFLSLWIIAGIMTLFGAFTQCELVSQAPVTGGLYEYLLAAFGEKVGFAYGWANFMIAGSGAIAAISYIFATCMAEFVSIPRFSPEIEAWSVAVPFLGHLNPLENFGLKLVASALILGLTWLNARGVQLGAFVQSLSTSSKVIALLGVIVAVFLFGRQPQQSGWSQLFTFGKGNGNGLADLYGYCLALLGAFWAYDGWGNVAYVGGEVREPEKTIPSAIIIGTLIIIALYLGINLAYLYVMPLQGIGSVPEDRVASSAMSLVFGGWGAKAISALILLCTFDTVNASTLTNARVYYAMAQRKMFPKMIGQAHPRFHTPHWSLWFQGLWSVFLVLSATFGIITSMYVFVNWIFYILMGVAVFVLRARNPGQERAFKMPGYPWIPIVYILFASLFVVLTLVADIRAFQEGKQAFVQSVMGIVLVCSGLPLYFYLKRRSINSV